MSEQLRDEVTSINSIYEPDTLESLDEQSIFILRLPARRDIAVRVSFPPTYPDVPPTVLGSHSTGSSVAKGEGQQLVDLLRTVLGPIYNPGMPCIFDLIEEATTQLQQSGLAAAGSEKGQASIEADGQNDAALIQTTSDHFQEQDDVVQRPPPWILSEVITEKKSIFVARAAQVESVQQAKQFLQHLLATDKKVARATHNITAWRIRGSGSIQYQDCDDDGETAAGGRLLHLLELMDVWNLMVVVTRWYGGVHLGPDRFRIINQAARDAVVKSGYDASASDSKKSKK